MFMSSSQCDTPVLLSLPLETTHCDSPERPRNGRRALPFIVTEFIQFHLVVVHKNVLGVPQFQFALFSLWKSSRTLWGLSFGSCKHKLAQVGLPVHKTFHQSCSSLKDFRKTHLCKPACTVFDHSDGGTHFAAGHQSLLVGGF